MENFVSGLIYNLTITISNDECFIRQIRPCCAEWQI